MRSVFTQKSAGIVGTIGLSLALVAGAGCDPDPVKGSGPGAHLFNYCAPCHASDGKGHQRYGAPSIAGLDSWYVESQLTKFKNGQRGAHPDDVEGLRMRPMMRVLKSQKDIVAVAKYVSELKPARPRPTVTGNPKRGKTLFAVCSACHGAKGLGNKALKAPPLVRSNDWYLLKQLHKFKDKVRGSGEPATLADGTQSPGQTMIVSVMSVKKKDMVDIVAYIAELAR